MDTKVSAGELDPLPQAVASTTTKARLPVVILLRTATSEVGLENGDSADSA
ncbi:hypothetical protein [Amycolatopsis nigrescens]|uniref:hypothetical protein n=1 Tax=Amycolatopsis nigrescens TaxID=381445 RepID=UPI00146BAFCA|nr:hypothetical protein [Amycolatopsis nigrescens]